MIVQKWHYTYVHSSNLVYFIVIILASTVEFSQLTYSIDENNGPLQPVLMLSNVLSTNITIQITDDSDTAIGKCTVPSKERSMCMYT